MAGPEFQIEEPSVEFDAFPSFETDDHSDGIKEVVTTLNAARTGKTVEEIRDQVRNLGEDFLKAGSKVDLSAGINELFGIEAAQAVSEVDLDKLFEAETKREKLQADVEEDPAPEASSLLQFKSGELYDQAAKLALGRTVGMMKIADRRLQDKSVTALGIVGDVVDLILSAPIDGLTLGGFSRTEKVEFLRNQISNPTISDKEFFELVESTIDDLEDAGLFTESNFLHLAGGISNIAEGGIGTTATLEKVGTVLDFGFGVSSLAKAGLKTAPKFFGRFGNTTKINGTLGGPDDAAKVLTDAVGKPGSAEAVAAGVAEEVVPSAVRIVTKADTGMIAPGAAIATQFERTNRVAKIFTDLGFTKSIDPAVLAAATPSILKKLSESVATSVRKRVRNLNVEETKEGNLFGVVTIGKADGNAFQDFNAAKRVADANEGTVVSTVLGGEEFFEVAIVKNLPTEGLVKQITVDELGKPTTTFRDFFSLNGIMVPFARAFGGNFLALPDRLTSLALRGESVLTKGLLKTSKVLNDSTKKLAKGELGRIDQIFYQMRDGERFANSRKAMSMSEFRSEWARTGGGAPSKAAEDHYLLTLELNNALYFLKADKIFKDVVNEGSEVLQWSTVRRSGETDDSAVIVNAIANDAIPAGEVVLDVVTREQLTVAQLSKSAKVYKVANGGIDAGDGSTAVYLTTLNPRLRRVYHSDVLGFNPGGPRNYEAIRHFVKQVSEVVMLNGRKVEGKARTFLGVTTREEAVFAAGEVNKTLDGLADLIPGLREMPTKGAAIEAISGLAGNAAAKSLIRTHSAWNNSIDSVEALVDFMRKQKMDPRVNVGIAAKDETLATLDAAGNPVFGGRVGETFGDAFEESLNLPRTNGPRGDQPLLGLGGNFADTVSPLDAIQNDLLRVAHSKAFESFGFQSINGWLAGANDLITPQGKKALSGLSPLAALKRADASVFSKSPGPETGAFLDARDAILRTLGTKSEYELKWEAMINRFGEFVYDKGFKKSADFLFNNKHAQSPLVALRGYTFDARLGMLDPAQLIIQASQSVNVIAIAPTKGLQATLTHLPLRMAMRGTEDVNLLREIGRRTSAFTGLDADDFVRLAQWTRRSGRLNVGDEVAEVSGLTDTLAKGTYRKVRDASRAFFNEGEKVPRSAAITVAWREFAEQFPKLDAFDEFGTKWITSRQNALTAGMTRANAAAWQRGPLSVPLQFMTFSSRMMESLLTDRLLSKSERLRLGAAQGVFWGAAGLGLGSTLDAYIQESGWQINETEYTLLRYGALDAFLNASLGTQAVFGARLATMEGFTEMFENMVDGNFIEVVSGPGGQLVGDVTSTLFDTFGDMVRGNVNMAEADLLRFARNFTGPNKLHNAWVMYTMGDYLSRNDDVIVSGLTKTDTLLHVFGGQIRDANLAYSRIEVMRDEKQRLKDLSRDFTRMTREATRLIEAGDTEGGIKLMRDIAVMRTALEPHQMRQTNDAFYPQADSLATEVLNRVRRELGGELIKAQQGDE